jgi:hypothetical protein
MEVPRNQLKRWPGQLSNITEEISGAERERVLQDLIRETERLKRRIVGAPDSVSRNLPPESGGEPGLSVIRSPSAPDAGMFAPVAAWIRDAARSWREQLQMSETIRSVCDGLRSGLREILSVLRLYQMRDAVLENLETVSDNGDSGIPAGSGSREKAHRSVVGWTRSRWPT